MKDETPRYLTDIPGGASCRMASSPEYDRDSGLLLRFAAFGLMPGVPVKVIRNSLWGPMVVHVRDTYLALGRKLARQLCVVEEKEAEVSGSPADTSDPEAE
ncbi:ferrous iron transport protein A [Desulfobotulus sp. H1]|uniref:Ferrous iron transport protein A n=1 Tax=Desulfobotulus pelophilus TaxID=2823377 RepID=A0ABT3N7N9_9BACT|nr:FeoA family protein [Desulfobotulus pelophilus]MCW7753470.1 ferrous iron transport protein A [Desulfobotulus pelophilus]